MSPARNPISVDFLVTKDSSASSLYGLYDVLTSVGVVWESFVTGEKPLPRFKPRIVAAERGPFRCASGVLLTADAVLDEANDSDVIVISGINASAIEPPAGLDPSIVEWLHSQKNRGATITSACTGALILAEAGLLDDIEATTHWLMGNIFRIHYPRVRLRLEKNLCIADGRGSIVTSGGTTDWQELALYIITQYYGVERAVRAAKLWQLPDQGELQLPFVAMPRAIPHGDAAVRDAQIWIAENYRAPKPVAAMTERSTLPPTTFVRRFKRATGYTPIDYVHAVRVEEAKQILETTNSTVEQVGLEVGYEDTASFRRLFKRRSGLSPHEYRRVFGQQRFLRYQARAS